MCNLNVPSFTEEQAEFDPQIVRPGSRYSHVQEVQERLNFLRYVTLDVINTSQNQGILGKKQWGKKDFCVFWQVPAKRWPVVAVCPSGQADLEVFGRECCVFV